MLKYYSALENAQDHKASREKGFAKALMAVYGIVSVVLLVNMLIASMSYDMVRGCPSYFFWKDDFDSSI